MKLKFNPSLDPKNNKPSSEETKGMGKGMIAVAMILFLGMLTFIFQGALEKQINPNQNVRSEQTQTGQIIVTLKRNRAGHYVSNGTINGQGVTFLLDTGATNVAVPQHIAKRLGLPPGRAISISTANGRTIGQQTLIEHLTIGQISLFNVRAIITPNLNEILLGMSALKQLEFSQKGKLLTIKQ
ncbi:MAG: TIGR02281 family clan AA aspartic protease [Pseudomonadota bacterium]